MSSSHHAMPILRTKLYRSPVPGDYVHREALLARLETSEAKAEMASLNAKVAQGVLSPAAAAQQMLSHLV